MSIEVKNVSKRWGNFVALDDVSLRIETGTLVALLGPSGSGKTSLLRILAGLETQDSGEVLFDGEDAAARAARDRGVGFVFQHYALFRHMTVFENVAFGLRVMPRSSRPSEQKIEAKVHELLALVQLEGFAPRYPSQLSGGQRQRVALARALAVEPKLLLLDEPFGALDAKVRKDLRRWLRRLHDELHVTSVFVTHDQEEALEVADRVVIIERGRIVQDGPPHEVYDKPATPFVFEFLGHSNRFEGRVHHGMASAAGVHLAAPSLDVAENSKAVAYVRPHDLELVPTDDGGPDAIRGVVTLVQRAGPLVRLELLSPGAQKPVDVELTRAEYAALPVVVGDEVALRPRHWQVYADGERA
jgi:sulfate transport system ATP-binding protein